MSDACLLFGGAEDKTQRCLAHIGLFQWRSAQTLTMPQYGSMQAVE